MSLIADPPAAQIPAAGGNSTHQLNNTGTDRLAFKVKSSNNNEYRIKPVFGFIEPGAATLLEITRTAGPPREDKLVVHFAVVAVDATEAKAAFEGAQPVGSITIPLSAA